MLISDHLNLTATSPIEGANFVDLTDLYSPRLRALCKEVDPSLDEGVYVQFPGPHYETPAEIGMVRAMGGHLVGMSTALEAIAAREAGLEVLGISLVTNLAAGISGEPLNHAEVLEAGRRRPPGWATCSARSCRGSRAGAAGYHRSMTSTSARNITCTVDEGVARVWLDRPDKLNGLTLDMLAELSATSRRLAKDKTLRAVVITGAGESFSAGLDFASALKDPRRIARTFIPSLLRGTNIFQEASWGWRRLPVPVIAVVQGHCYGGGLQIALGADFRFSTPDAQWSVLEAKWGLIPDMSGIKSLAELVGMDTAKLITMTGDTFDGTRAKELGLVTEVTDDPMAAADELVEQLKTRSPDAVAAAKRLFNGTWTSSPRRTFARERAEQLALLVNANTKIAREAAFKRERPVFTARKK